jgi:hypothetical protein
MLRILKALAIATLLATSFTACTKAQTAPRELPACNDKAVTTFFNEKLVSRVYELKEISIEDGRKYSEPTKEIFTDAAKNWRWCYAYFASAQINSYMEGIFTIERINESDIWIQLRGAHAARK